MYDKLFKLLEKKSEEYNDEIKTLNISLNKTKYVYDRINKKNIDVFSIINDEVFLSKVYSFLDEHNNISKEIFESVMDSYSKYIKETDEMINTYGLTREIVLNDKLLRTIEKERKTDSRKKVIYEVLMKIKENEDRLFELAKSIIIDSVGFISDYHKSILDKKEKVKDDLSQIKYTLNNIKNNNPLTNKNILSINECIYDISSEEEKKELLALLDIYLLNTSLKNKEVKQNKDDIVKKDIIKPIKYDIDYDLEEKENDPIIDNYILILSYMDKYDDVKNFLNSLSIKFNIQIIVKKIINNLGSYNNMLNDYLIKYLNEIEEKNKVLDEDECDNLVLFNGFLSGKSVLLDDINSIDKINYSDILQGINEIKNNTMKSKSDGIETIAKVLKYKKDRIRIAYKRLGKNCYIILGIYFKKDMKGKEIVKSIKNRLYLFSNYEKYIKDSLNKENIKEKFTENNKKMENEILNTLNISLSEKKEIEESNVKYIDDSKKNEEKEYKKNKVNKKYVTIFIALIFVFVLTSYINFLYIRNSKSSNSNIKGDFSKFTSDIYDNKIVSYSYRNIKNKDFKDYIEVDMLDNNITLVNVSISYNTNNYCINDILKEYNKILSKYNLIINYEKLDLMLKTKSFVVDNYNNYKVSYSYNKLNDNNYFMITIIFKKVG